MKNKDFDTEDLLQYADSLPSPPSTLAIGMLSDVQEILRSHGSIAQNEDKVDLGYVLDVINDVKILIEERLATKDAEGRHSKPKAGG